MLCRAVVFFVLNYHFCNDNIFILVTLRTIAETVVLFFCA
nr:MAG TPA: hypothetical protein [Caudoviricetes sp.]